VTRQGPHPLRFFALILPFGAAFGYASVALQWVATQRHGVPVAAFAAEVIAPAFALHAFKWAWAPLVDATLGKRTWYLIGLALTVAGVMASAAIPISRETLHALAAVVVASQVGLTFLGMACEALMGALPLAEKGRASGFYQAGNFLGLGLGGGLALSLETALPEPWMAGAVLCVLMLPCALALVGLPEPARHVHRLRDAVVGLGRDLRAMVVEKVPGRGWILSAAGLSGIFIVLSPVGAGAAGNLWPSLAAQWHAGPGAVAVVNGWLGGVVGAVGALMGGFVADQLNRKLAYALAGGLTAITGLLMAAGPRSATAYVGFVLAYTAFNGMAFAAFSAFVLETIGHGAVATKYNIFAGLANLAIAYMTRVDAGAFARWSATAMLAVDAACTLGGVGVLFAMIALVRRFAPRSDRASAQIAELEAVGATADPPPAP